MVLPGIWSANDLLYLVAFRMAKAETDLLDHACIGNLGYLGSLNKACRTSAFSMGKALGASKITVRYQVTVPEEVRKKLRLKEGDTLIFYEEDGKVRITAEI